ncbi:uncharacterized protein LOC100836720 isoform X3 [Brachypodium distachyon]|uniref:Uncharacterized protein n=1 Tax=Brachypodium distachyon TaxID=15368 RepID=A0A0Q3K4Z4_BRADI|nr:uncharacterized protein LOC100836720 isoform X3 [Brachypodium distachyon]KQK19580.1 hypothetical protein BRADI_1g49150v3 [Brachypodium distachyon]|eukprot:XP_024312594.1 uncharacterized protein LOC100836720 isoform X3 [Brachypodium distachyon]
MTHRHPGPSRRAAARAAMAPPYSDRDRDRVLGEEVLYLHSLWRQGPPPDSAPAPPARVPGGSIATRIRAERRQRRKLEHPPEPEDPGSAWPLPPSPPASPASRWAVASSSPARQSPPPSPGSLAQQAALRAADEFFSRHASRDDEEGSDSESDDEEEEEEAARFFMGLFERDAALRGYYERRCEDGEFLCMGCAGKKARKGKCRKFHGCLGLVHHAHGAKRCGRPRAHRALTAALCRVLGWDMERLPSIVTDPRGTLGQALDGDGAAAHEIKEDIDTRNNAVPLSDGEAVKKDVVIDTGKCVPSINDNAGEVHEQEKGIGSAEKEDTDDIDPPSSEDIPKEVCKTVQEEEAATENGEHANNVVRTGGDDSANLGNNPMDSPKS